MAKRVLQIAVLSAAVERINCGQEIQLLALGWKWNPKWINKFIFDKSWRYSK
jgi:hypothetical protein